MEGILVSLGGQVAGTVLQLVLPMFIAWLGYALNKMFNRIEEKTGLEIEQKHREAFEKAITTAAQMIIEGATTSAEVMANEPNRMDKALAHVKKSVPDAINGLKKDALDAAGELTSQAQEVITNKIKTEVAKLTRAWNIH